MKNLQRWFERIAGFDPLEYERYRQAKQVFSRENFDDRPLRLPACWRRRVRIGTYEA